MGEIKFDKNFVWGAATSSYQVEGAAHEDGKGQSMWDTFSHTKGKTFNGDTGDVACDHYHRFKEDVALMKKIGLRGYRFSIAWPRIFPLGSGKINQKGVDFYNRLIEELLKNDIEPAVTMYHWDLPQALEDKGGWASRDICSYFTEYAGTLYKLFGDRVKKWITLNEPRVSAQLGYSTGEHAPGIKNDKLSIQVSHYLMLAHAMAVKEFRIANIKDGKIGATLNLGTVYSATDSEEDRKAAVLVDGTDNRWYLDPVLKGTYPQDIMELYKEEGNAPEILPGDMDILSSSKVDFIGVNYYSRTVVKKCGPHKRDIQWIHPEGKYTEMDWEVYPRGLYDLLVRIKNDYNDPHIYITENGAAFKDTLTPDGKIEDKDRIEYLKGHFIEAHKAIEAGVKLDGYYIWSLMDNFEWSYGYSKKFGIIYVNPETNERILKDSAKWYSNVIKENGLEA